MKQDRLGRYLNKYRKQYTFVTYQSHCNKTKPYDKINYSHNKLLFQVKFYNLLVYKRWLPSRYDCKLID